MFSSTKKVLWLIAGVILAGGVSIYISAEEIFLSPNLANPIQKIQKIMFVDPVGNGGTWKTTGQVEVTARSNRVTINGSLVTNVENGNSV
ncbi:MAG: hypothetical protein LBU27_08605 [Candidatus Peribacteria bacterium]|jgi:hypothetical protein|nr:hypothetical protein [Candidatus Peribacteria bacterium]